MSKSETQPGVTAALTDETGYVITTATDFSPSEFDGVSLRRSQEIRAEAELARKAVREYAAIYATHKLTPVMLDRYSYKEIMDMLCRQLRLKVQFIAARPATSALIEGYSTEPPVLRHGND